MVDMFFYRDPEEVEKQQQEEAQAKLAAATAEATEPVADWGAATAAGGIDPTLATEGASQPLFTNSPISNLTLPQVSTGQQSLKLPALQTGQLSPLVVMQDGAPTPVQLALAGIKRSSSGCITQYYPPRLLPRHHIPVGHALLLDSPFMLFFIVLRFISLQKSCATSICDQGCDACEKLLLVLKDSRFIFCHENKFVSHCRRAVERIFRHPQGHLRDLISSTYSHHVYPTRQRLSSTRTRRRLRKLYFLPSFASIVR